MKIALIGRDIRYTMSPRVHAAIARATKIDIEFSVRDIPYDELESVVRELLRDSDGFFITKPYKADIARYLDCGDIGSVNLVRSRDKSVYNTDGSGLVRALDRNFDGWRKNVRSSLVLGAGGAAVAAAEALRALGIRVYVLDRTLMHAIKLCSACGAELYANQDAELVVNCTSVGADGADVFKTLCVMPKFEYAFDLVYFGGDTPFVRRTRALGGQAVNGLDMLVYQAIEGDGILLGKQLDIESVFDAVKKDITGDK